MHHNILIWVIDCLRADKCFTPPADKPFQGFPLFQRRGVSFTGCYSAAVNTTPSMTSILTGCYPFVHGVHKLTGPRLAPQYPSLAQLLTDKGYHCRAEVTGPLLPALGLDSGFHEYHYRSACEHIFTGWGDQFLAGLRDWGRDQSSFLFLHTFELHEKPVRDKPFDTRLYGATEYDRTLYGVDNFARKLVDILDLDNTTVVLTGDHGEVIARRDFYRKLTVINRTLFKYRLKGRAFTVGHGYDVREDLVRVPLILSGHSCPHGEFVATPVSHVDIVPTISGLVSLSKSHTGSLPGVNLLPLADISPADSRPIFFEACDVGGTQARRRRIGVRRGRYVLFYSLDEKDDVGELYDVERDPETRTNLARREDRVARDLSDCITRFIKKSESEARGQAIEGTELSELEEKLRSLGYM